MVWARMVWNIFFKYSTTARKDGSTKHWLRNINAHRTFQIFVLKKILISKLCIISPVFVCPQFSVGLSHNILIRYEIIWKFVKEFWGIWIFLRGSKHAALSKKKKQTDTTSYRNIRNQKTNVYQGKKYIFFFFCFPKCFWRHTLFISVLFWYFLIMQVPPLCFSKFQWGTLIHRHWNRYWPILVIL